VSHDRNRAGVKSCDAFDPREHSVCHRVDISGSMVPGFEVHALAVLFILDFQRIEKRVSHMVGRRDGNSMTRKVSHERRGLAAIARVSV
jgi:hypothetical protein